MPSQLNDADLIGELNRLALHQRQTTVELIVHLAEFDARDLHLRAGYPSLFVYCTAVLRLSEHEAYHRIEAARDVRKFPILLERLRAGSLTLTTLRLLAPHLTRENHAELLAAADGKSKRQVAELLARLFPQPDVPPSVRKLQTRRPAFVVSPSGRSGSPATRCGTREGSDATGPEPTRIAPGMDAPPVVAPVALWPTARPSVMAPLSADRYEVRFTASAQTREKLCRAQDLLRHAVPSGDLAEIFDRGLTALLADLARKKFATTERPRTGRSPAPGSRHVPAEVRRAVGQRDGRRCAFVSADGRRCEATAFLEFHHVVPYGVGGRATVETIQLRCGAHNRHEADLYYGVSKGGGLPREGRLSHGIGPHPNSVRTE